MRQRGAPIAALAVELFVINVIARLITRLGFDGDDTAQNWVSLAMFAVIALVVAVAAFVRAQQKPPSRWLPEIAAAVIAGMVLTVLLGPFVSGDKPLSGGAGYFFSQIWLYAAFTVVGALLGYWIATVLGRDYRSRSLSAYAQARTRRPRRVVVRR